MHTKTKQNCNTIKKKKNTKKNKSIDTAAKT